MRQGAGCKKAANGERGPGVATMTDVIVLCYHALSPTWEAALSTTPERFERQIALLLGRGYRGVTFTEAVLGSSARGAPDRSSAHPGGSSSRDRSLAVTFDDAYLSVFELARPILERLGLVATVFVPTDPIETGALLSWPGTDRWLGGPHERELTPMSWEQLRQLAAAGWEIGSHTGSHPYLTQVEDGALADELARSKAACERHLDRPCTSLAYPYGDVDARVAAAAARAGYGAAASLPRRLDSHRALEWPRIGVYWADDDLRFRLKVSPVVRRLRRSGAWSSLDGARRKLSAMSARQTA
jgi:peptidoglycan/xylan/chitin deacetylase (PgdA/CDA1 family)